MNYLLLISALFFQFVMTCNGEVQRPTKRDYEMHLAILSHEVDLNSRIVGVNLIDINKYTMDFLAKNAHKNVELLKKMLIDEPYLAIAISKNKELFSFAHTKGIKIYRNTTSKTEVEKWMKVFDLWGKIDNTQP